MLQQKYFISIIGAMHFTDIVSNWPHEHVKASIRIKIILRMKIQYWYLIN